jgi:DNA repair ATPase RecN
MIINEHLKAALNKPSGARYYRCALQVNPFEYLKRHRKETPYGDEASYNAAIIQACIDENIEVIAVTDHYRIKSSANLIKEAEKAGLKVFPGFEAVTKEGVHFLCFLESSLSLDVVQAKIADCGIHDSTEPSPIGKYDTGELLRECRKWSSAICIAAHVASDGGLLRMLKGQSRIAAWKDTNLLACSLPGPVSDAPDDVRPILQNKDVPHRRNRPIAVINCHDVNDPTDLKKPGTSCWIKMSSVSIAGLHQAFLDPKSRVRLASDPMPEDHTEFIAIAWDGQFLEGESIHFNENLNVLIGGRGTGKSTVIESLRYVLQLDPIGDDARKAHDGIVNNVLKNGTKISLLVRSHRPDVREFLIERTVPNPPVVKDASGNVLTLGPRDVLPHMEIFGQHEISELSKSPEKLTYLLERFMEYDPSILKRKSDLKRELERSRARILDVQKEIKQIDERLSLLPSLMETLKRYQEAKLEDRLKDQSQLVREDRILKMADERLKPFKTILTGLENAIPVDVAFVSEKALQDLPGHDILRPLHDCLVAFDKDAQTVTTSLQQAIGNATKRIADVKTKWDVRKQNVQTAYEKILRELQKSKVDGEEFLRLRRQVEDLKPLSERKALLFRNEKEYLGHRRNLLDEWEELKRSEFQRLEKSTKKVNKQLTDRVRIQVAFAGDRKPLFDLLRQQVEGRFAEAIEVLKQKADLSVVALVESCRAGRDNLVRKYSMTAAQAERLVQAGELAFMQIEELELPSTVTTELNVSPDGQPVQWQRLEDLSKGQKATAVLLLLLLESDVPLVVDQPEDDLDNRFITDGIVPKMREEKRRRQFVFATHNANIPVLGDAELIVGLHAIGEAGMGKAEIPIKHMGSIDNEPVRELVEEILEGGRNAFETRRLKYGF